MNEKKETKTLSAKSILPIATFLAILGTFFTVASIIYVVTNYFCTLEHIRAILYVIEATIFFVLMLLTFFLTAIKNYKKLVELNTEKFSLNCLDCIETKMTDGFHSHGLLYLDELIHFESQLANDNAPQKCTVLVYTSDLATEKSAEDEVKKNIEAGVQYIVLYFSNSCNEDEFVSVQKLYGETNLVDLTQNEDYMSSFDGELAKTLGFDIMIYKNSENEIRGFFAVDFVPDEKPERPCHTPTCPDKCNYGKDNSNPFYKEISNSIAKQLYLEGLKLQKDSRK